MKIDKTIPEKLNILRQLNEDLTKQKVGFSAPTVVDDVTFGAPNVLPGVTDTFDDTTIVPNTQIQLSYTREGQTQKIVFNYRRLHLKGVAQEEAVDLDNAKGNNEILRHDSEGVATDAEAYKKVAVDKIKEVFGLTTDADIADGEEYDIKTGVSTFNVAISIHSYLYHGVVPYKALTRAKNFAEYVKKDDTHGFSKVEASTKLSNLELKHLIFPVGLNEVPEGFANTDVKIDKLTLHDKVTSIGSRAFASSVSSLSDIEGGLPASLTSIGEEAFVGATSDVVAVPGNLTTIGNKAFGIVKGLTFTTLPSYIAALKVDAARTTDNNGYLKYLPTDEQGRGDAEHSSYSELTFNGRHEDTKLFLTATDLSTHADLLHESSFVSLIKDVTLSKDYTAVPDDAFNHLTLGEGHVLNLKHVTTIGNAFKDATIDKVEFSPALTQVAEHAFQNTTVTKVVVDNKAEEDRIKALAPVLASATWEHRESTTPTPPPSSNPANPDSSEPKVITSEGLHYHG